jgi:hypothetical protein
LKAPEKARYGRALVSGQLETITDLVDRHPALMLTRFMHELFQNLRYAGIFPHPYNLRSVPIVRSSRFDSPDRVLWSGSDYFHEVFHHRINGLP